MNGVNVNLQEWRQTYQKKINYYGKFVFSEIEVFIVRTKEWVMKDQWIMLSTFLIV